MIQLNNLERVYYEQVDELEEQIISALNQGQGFRLGESTVVSYYLHRNNRKRPEEIEILLNRDAGQELAGEKIPFQMLHIDVFHEPAAVAIQPLAQALLGSVKLYQNGQLTFSQAVQCINHCFPSQTYQARQKVLIRAYTKRIYVETGTGSGSLFELLEQQDNRKPPKSRKRNHVHVLFKFFSEGDFGMIPGLVDTVETELANQGVEIRKVERILHVEKSSRLSLPLYAVGFNPERHRLWQLATSLSVLLSSPEDVVEFLNAFQPGWFRHRESLSRLRKKHGNLRGLLNAMAEAGLLKKGLIADKLTREGSRLLNFVVHHQRELESELRKALRKVPVPNSKYISVRRTLVKARDKRYTYTSKTVAPMKDSWLGNIAVPETLIQAAKHHMLDKKPTLAIGQEDIRVYQREVSKPCDICLLIDESASMSGPKMKAVWRLAEHLLLATRDRIAVVVFQEQAGRVVVPFTRDYSRLKLGLRSVEPKGRTPMADGIMEAIKLIKNRHVRNPLIILITDGVPTCGKWSSNARQDALKASDSLANTRARVICIGIASNQEFLKLMAEHAQASLYILDKPEDGGALIEIVRQERKF